MEGTHPVIHGGVEKLQTLHPDLSRLIRHVAETWDVVILETSRTPERQAELVAAGKSKTLQSKHLVQPDGYAHAVDWAPLPIDWNDARRWYYFGGFALGVAQQMGVQATFGGDWNRNTEVRDQAFNDLDHLELG